MSGKPSIRRILIIKPSSLGDIIHTLPAADRIKRAYPDSPLSWVVNTEWRPVLDGCPCVDEVIEFPRSTFRGAAGLIRAFKWASDLGKSGRPWLVLDFQGLLRSALIGRSLRPEKFLGLSDAREGAGMFYDATANVSAIHHSVDRYLALAELAGAGGTAAREPEFPLPAGTPPPGMPEHPYVVIHPYSRGEGKSLPLEHIGALCRMLSPLRVVLVGRGPALADPPANMTDLLNRTTLPELLHILQCAAFTVSVDSGPMHLAAACSDKVVAIHTWSDPAKVGPYRPGAWVWKSGRLARKRDGGFAGEESARLPAVSDLEQIASVVKDSVQNL
jgi:heptosyltransferase-1